MNLLLGNNKKKKANELITLLEKNNYHIDLICNKNEILGYLQTSHYDGLILNFDLPVTDILVIIQKLRQLKIRIPIMVLCPDQKADTRISVLDAGADDCLGSPYISSELLARIRAMLRRIEPFSPDIMEYEQMTYDPATCELCYTDHSIRLVGKECRIMELLIRNPRQIITTEQFLTQLWGCDTNVVNGNLWVFVSNLRKKMQKINTPVSIKAIRGVGYCLD